MLRKVFFTFLFAGFIIGLLYFGLQLSTRYRSVELEPRSVDVNKIYADKLDFSKPTPEQLNTENAFPRKLKQTAWIPDWDFKRGFASLQIAADYLDSVSPVWYYLDSDGLIQPKRTGYDQIRPFTKDKGVKLIPSISTFKEQDLTKVLNDDTKLKAHTDYLISEVEKYDYDGLDLDYESFYLNDQPGYFQLIKTLSDYLHSKGKILSITLVEKATESDIGSAFRQTKKVQEWSTMARYADEMRIMTYDYTSYSTTYPGPISPISWQEAILRYAVTKIDREKIILAAPLYVYAGWAQNPNILENYLGILSNPGPGTVQASPMVYTQIKDLRDKAMFDILEPQSLEKVIQYQDKDKKDNQQKTFIAYYQDAESSSYRVQLAKKYGIAGIAYWRMGGEDTDVYKLIK
jgi:spore germination protein YaaH